MKRVGVDVGGPFTDLILVDALSGRITVDKVPSTPDHIARHKRPYNFSLYCDLPWQTHPLVPRRHRLTATERVTAPRGEVLVPLDEGEVRDRARALRAAGVEAV